MSQDSADELNGRFTALQALTFGINESAKLAGMGIADLAAGVRDSIDFLRLNSAKILEHLAGIERNTDRIEAIENNIGSVKCDMKSIKDGISDFNLRGIVLRK